jgi:hypothetical protein
MTFTAVGRGLHKHQTNRWRGSFDGALDAPYSQPQEHPMERAGECPRLPVPSVVYVNGAANSD